MKNLKTMVLFCACICIAFTSCYKREVPPLTNATLVGWWKPQNYLVEAKLYFGADGFFYNDTIAGKAPIAGYWKQRNDTIICSAQQNGSPNIQFVISHLNNSTLRLSKVGVGVQQTYSKLDTPAITSPPIFLVAGNGASGYLGDDGPATYATIEGDRPVATDKHGNIYISNGAYGVIREISVNDGTIKTIAGNGKPGSSKYYRNPIMATCDCSIGPGFLAVDGDDNVYFTDFYANAIYKLSRADNMIYLVAGNGTPGFSGDGDSAVNASLYHPYGLALDNKHGYLYILDLGNARIRKVNLSTGIITTFAGNGSAFNDSGDGNLAINATINSFGIATDVDGNVYIATGSASIRKISAETNIITTIAGAHYTTLSEYKKGDGGPAVNAMFRLPWAVTVSATGDVFVADNVDNAIRKINHSTNIITTVAGTGYAGRDVASGPHATGYSLYKPTFLATDPAGKTLYIAVGTNRLYGVGPFYIKSIK